MNIETRTELDNLKAQGHFAQASSLLKEQLSRDENLLPILLPELILIYIKQSRYHEAHTEAQKLEKLLCYKEISFPRVLASSLLLSMNSFINNNSIKGLLSKAAAQIIGFDKQRMSSYASNDGLLWGVYWQDMRKALKLNVFCVLSAQTPAQKIRSTAFLHYTLAFMGFSGLSLRGLRRLLTKCESEGRTESVKDLLTWVGVAYQMGAYAKECLAIHDRLAAEFPTAEPFHQIISFASQLNLSISELGPQQVQFAVDRCFSISFALQESRNHIQIYAGKAALLSLEGRSQEALSFLDRAELAAKRNSNTLDNMIFHRIAAVAMLNQGDFEKAIEHIALAAEGMNKYGPNMWYRQELARMLAIAKYQRSKTFIKKVFLVHQFVIKCLFLPNLNLLKKTIRLYVHFISQNGMSYWTTKQESDYLRSRILETHLSNKSSIQEQVSSALTSAILNQQFINSENAPTVSELKEKLTHIFVGATIIESRTLHEGLNSVKANFGLSSSFIHNEESDSIRASCANGDYYIAVQAPKSIEIEDTFAIGVIVKDLGINSHEIVEMALRIMLTLFSASRLGYYSREERIRNQNKMAIASIATQVAHDIRSPLMALQFAMHSLGKNHAEEIDLLKQASSRIRLIAEDLLQTAKNLPSHSVLPASVKKNFGVFQISRAIIDIVEEKKLNYPMIGFKFECETGDEVIGDRVHFQRILSNLFDNSIEAFTHRDHGLIEISVQRYRDRIGVHISDNGRGIPEDILCRVGEPGFSHGKALGNGLGISFAKSKLNEWGGGFQLASKPNVGTMVTIMLATKQS